jgi:tetratricopeptide (TPR) repeat protein
MARINWTAFGNWEKAVSLNEKALSLDPDSLWSYAGLYNIYFALGDIAEAERWLRRAPDKPDAFQLIWPRVQLSLYRNDRELAEKWSRRYQSLVPRDWHFAHDLDLIAGRIEVVQGWVDSHHPQFLEESPRVDLEDHRTAINIARFLMMTSQAPAANRLLEEVLRGIASIPRIGAFGFGIADVQIYTLQGKREKALLKLREAVDAGWRGGSWPGQGSWWSLKEDPTLEPLHDLAEYQDLVEEIGDDMARQLEKVRAMKKAEGAF